MTTLVVEKLATSLEVDIIFNNNERVHIVGFYPYLLMNNSPAGTFVFELIKSGFTLFSKSFTSTDIKTSLSTALDYAHVFYPILPTDHLSIDAGTYKLKLSSSGYIGTEASYLGWIRQHENVQNEMAYTPASDMENSLAFRIKIQKRGIS